jgi:16S rRNA U516 pseudouridylate synthase RsuA-like enzyme
VTDEELREERYKQVRRCLLALRLEVPELVANDVERIVLECVDELRAEVARLTAGG